MYPDYPDPLILENGRAVATSEVFGRVLEEVPEVSWSVVEESGNDAAVAGVPVVAKRLQGRVDSSAFPEISVSIDMTLVLPAGAKGPVPVLLQYTFSPKSVELPTAAAEELDLAEPPPSAHTLIRAGWGYATINPQRIQADNGGGLTKGIIGLVNKGQSRKPEDWGALRAWGASRGLECIEKLPGVDASKIGIEGVSRYGKAALVAMAFEPRFSMGLIASSGAGGAAPHRRDFGERVENFASSGAYHWMAGNFLKYAAESSSFGRMVAGALPVDAPQLVALAAPRLVFVSYGIPEKGDALWLD